MNAELGKAVGMADFSSLSALRHGAPDSVETRRAVALQFEALFIGEMLKQMRQATAVEGGLFESSDGGVHEQMYHSQLAQIMARRGGIGLADAIMRHFGDEPAAALPPEQGLRRFNGPNMRTIEGSAVPAPGDAVSPAAVRRTEEPVPATRSRGFAPADPRDFVREVWPHARRAAAALGTTPDVIVAQAALETGWGRHMIETADGTPSFNLFGIKAGAGWEGPTARASTLEFVGGIPEQRREPFRVYGSLAQAFDDYVALIGSAPRYGDLIGRGSEAFARGLQSAGYATDPNYADKILGILQRGLPGREHAVQAEDTVARPIQAKAAAADRETADAGPMASVRAGDEA